MNSRPTEAELVAELDRCDGLIHLCAAGKISFSDFCANYDNFYWSHALDGHEADAEGLVVLSKFAGRIAVHQTLAHTILAQVCDDADASKESYIKAGRFGSREAVARLKLVAARIPRAGA
jgi:hypothetical protein